MVLQVALMGCLGFLMWIFKRPTRFRFCEGSSQTSSTKGLFEACMM